MGSIKLAVADAAITFLWVAYIAFVGPATELIASTLNLQGFEFDIVMGLLTLNIFLFRWVGGVFGGALWNPAPVLELWSMWAAGVVGGVLLEGPRLLLVDLCKGSLYEVIMTFLIYVVMFKRPKSRFWKSWIIVLSMVVVVVVRTSLGPPPHGYVSNGRSIIDGLLSYSLAPLAGSYIAAGAFRRIFPEGHPEETAALEEVPGC